MIEVWEVWLVFGFITGMTFLGTNLFLHFFIYPMVLIDEYMNRIRYTDDSGERHKIFKEFVADIWIPASKGTIAFSVICGVVGTSLCYLRLMLN